MEVMTKRRVSLRLDEDLLALLEAAQDAKGTMYWQRDRTWLIEHAIEQVYTPVIIQKDDNKAEAQEDK